MAYGDQVNLSQIPWWAWAVGAWFLLNVMLDYDLSLFVLIAGAFLVRSLLGRDEGGGSASPGEVEGRERTPDVLPQLPPQDAREGGATPSPWQTVPRPAPRDEPGRADPQDGMDGTDPGPGQMPRIDVPTFPGEGTGAAGGTAYQGTAPGAGPVSGPSDPVVSLAQLQLGRSARDLHAAAAAGSTAEARRVLGELDDLARRTHGALGRSQRTFTGGLRRLQRDIAAARDEEPVGPKVAQVVRAAGALGQTGRYE